MPTANRQTGGYLSGQEMQDVLDHPTPITLRVRGPRPWVDVTHPYYAVRLGTGQTTLVRSRNRAGMQDAINDSQSDGGQVFIPGVVEVNGNLTFNSTEAAPLHLSGPLRRRGKLQFIGDYGLRDLGTPAAPGPYHIGTVSLHLRHLTIDCDQAKFSGTAGLWTTNDAAYLSLDDVVFGENYLVGWKADDTYHCNLRRVTFESGYGMIARRRNSSQAAQFLFDECHWNASNGILAFYSNIGGEMHFLRSHFQNYVSNYYGAAYTNPITGAAVADGLRQALGAVWLVACDEVTFDTCTFEANDVDSATVYIPTVLLDNCGTVKFDNSKFVTGVSASHDLIRVQTTAPATVGCGSLIIDGASINGAFIAGRRNYFVNWASGTGRLTFSAPIIQTMTLAADRIIPLLVGVGTGANAMDGISYNACFPAKTGNTTVAVTDETTVYTASIAANSLFAGRILETRLSGRFTTTLATDQLTVRLKVNGTTVATATTPTAATYTNEPLNLRGNVTVRTFAVQQSETLTVVGTVTGAGDATVVVTANGMAGSPITLAVAVALNDTAVQVAAKVRTALDANANIAAWFKPAGGYTSGADVVLMAEAAAANDATMNISIDNGTCTGLTTVATSTNTVAGVAGAIMADLELFAANVARTMNPANTGTIAVDTSAGGDLTVTVQWSNVNAGTTTTITQATTRD